jgi:hypothetical protein
MKILFTFENALPSNEADAEVFVTTAKYLAGLISEAWLYVPVADAAACATVGGASKLTIIPARVPRAPAVLRHLCCGLRLVRH